MPLEHAYDPVKRREYYERTKQLKGRRKGAFERSATPRQSAALTKGGTTSKSLTRQPSSTERLKQLQVKLDQLKKTLELLVKQAKARSGVETPTKKSASSSTTKTGSSSTTTKKLTTSQKKDAAKRAEEYRKKSDNGPAQKALALKKQIAETQKKIEKAKEQLAKARKTSTTSKSLQKTSSAGANSFKRTQ